MEMEMDIVMDETYDDNMMITLEDTTILMLSHCVSGL